jgi:hypothetical protein
MLQHLALEKRIAAAGEDHQGPLGLGEARAGARALAPGQDMAPVSYCATLSITTSTPEAQLPYGSSTKWNGTVP